MKLVGQNFRGHGLAGAALAGEQGADAETARAFIGKTPFLVNRQAVLRVGGDLAQNNFLRLGQH